MTITMTTTTITVIIITASYELSITDFSSLSWPVGRGYWSLNAIEYNAIGH